MLTCTRLRNAVITSGLLLVAGVVLETLGQIPMLAVPCCYLALFSILAAAALLILTFLASLVPSEARRLKECQH